MWRPSALLLSALCASLVLGPALAQELRSSEIIDRALRARPDIDAGKRLYGEQCATCHGARAFGNADEVVPALAGQLPIYLIKQMVDMAESERASAVMHRIAAKKSSSTPQALGNLARYLGGLDPNPKPETGDGSQLAMGKRHYQGLCAYCHGAQGGGNEAHATPALRRQHYSYLIMQTRELAGGHRYSVNPEILDMLQQLSYDQLTSIADYASRLPMVDTIPVQSEEAAAETPVQ